MTRVVLRDAAPGGSRRFGGVAATAEIENLLVSGRLGAARLLFDALAPREAAGLLLHARLLQAEGREAAAGELLDAAIAEPTLPVPAMIDLRLERGRLHLRQGRAGPASEDAAALVGARLGGAAARALLGRAMLDLGRANDAAACLSGVVAEEPADPANSLALAESYLLLGRADLAAGVLDAAIVRVPSCASLRTAAIRLALQSGDRAAAVAAARAAEAADALDGDGREELARTLAQLGEIDAARAAWRAALLTRPDDARLRHHLAIAGGRVPATRAPAAYIAAFFDREAAGYDRSADGQRTRAVAAAALELLPRDIAAPAIELGCGSGLLASTLGNALATAPFGLDLSGAMLARAASRGVHSGLCQRDALAWAEDLDGSARGGDPRHFGLILAEDVSTQFGDLSALCRALAARLSPAGTLLLGADLATPGQEGALGSDGRYRHAPGELDAVCAAAGLTTCSAHDIAALPGWPRGSATVRLLALKLRHG